MAGYSSSSRRRPLRPSQGLGRSVAVALLAAASAAAPCGAASAPVRPEASDQACLLQTSLGSQASEAALRAVAEPDDDLMNAFVRVDGTNKLAVRDGYTPDGQFEVNHVAILNKVGIWVLMFVMITVVAAVMARMGSGAKAESEAKQRGEAGPGAEASSGDLDDGEQTLWQKLMPRLHLLITAIALNITMVLWGIAQEYMMTNKYHRPGYEPERMPSSVFLTMMNRIVTVVVAFVILKFNGAPIAFSGLRLTCIPSITNSISSWLQYQSLLYVSFPLQSATKSAKLLPVMIMSSLRGKAHKAYDYFEALVIVVALVIFAFEVERHGTGSAATWVGVLMLVGVLCMDSITPHAQDMILESHPKMTVMQISFSMSCVSVVLLFIALCAKGELMEVIRFLSLFPSAWVHVFVLSVCSTLSQILIPYTIKNFGPVAFTVMITVRQMISTIVSSVAFGHEISALGWIAVAMAFSTVIKRAVRPMAQGERNRRDSENGAGPRQVGGFLRSMKSHIVICILGMHVPLLLYSIAQEFMSVHVWQGDQFDYSMLLIATNRTLASLFAVGLLKAEGLSVWVPSMKLAIVPAAFNTVGTWYQYRALSFLAYPIQSLLKTPKVLLVMAFGRLLRTRTYVLRDYVEAAVICSLAGFFAWNFNSGELDFSKDGSTQGLLHGVMLMCGYVLFDAMTSNSEDYLYQRHQMDPAHMLLGMQCTSGAISWLVLLCNGQLPGSLRFLLAHPGAWVPVLVLASAEAVSSYACTMTVRLFGPATFTLILMSHQIVSLLASVAFFGHPMTALCGVCLATTCTLTIAAAVRLASAKTLMEPEPHARGDSPASGKAGVLKKGGPW